MLGHEALGRLALGEFPSSGLAGTTSLTFTLTGTLTGSGALTASRLFSWNAYGTITSTYNFTTVSANRTSITTARSDLPANITSTRSFSRVITS